MALFLLCVVFIPLYVSAYPQGAPEAACLDMFCHSDKPPLAFSFGYTITLSRLSYSPNGEVKGTLSSNSNKHFRGFLLRAVRADSVPKSMQEKKTTTPRYSHPHNSPAAHRNRRSSLMQSIFKQLEEQGLGEHPQDTSHTEKGSLPEKKENLNKTVADSSSSHKQRPLSDTHSVSKQNATGTKIQNRLVTSPPQILSNGTANSSSKSDACTRQERLVKNSWNLSPVGHFLTTSSTMKPICKGNGTYRGLTHTDNEKKYNISFVWKAPAHLEAAIVFHASVVYSRMLWWNNIISPVVVLSDETSTSVTTSAKPTTTTSSTAASLTTELTEAWTRRGEETGDNFTSPSRSDMTVTMPVGQTNKKTDIGYSTSTAMGSTAIQHTNITSSENDKRAQTGQTSGPNTHSATTSSSTIQTTEYSDSTTSNRSYEIETTRTTESANEMYGHITLPDWWGNDSTRSTSKYWILCSVALIVTIVMF